MGQTNVMPQNGNTAANLFNEYWGMVLRRKWILLGAVLVSLGAAMVYCKVATKVYRSDTLILLEDQKISKPMRKGTATSIDGFL